MATAERPRTCAHLILVEADILDAALLRQCQLMHDDRVATFTTLDELPAAQLAATALVVCGVTSDAILPALGQLRQRLVNGAILAILPAGSGIELIEATLRAGASDCLIAPVAPLLLERRLHQLRPAATPATGNDFLCQVLDALPFGVTVCNEDGQILHLNAAEARMHGQSPAELLGQSAQTFAPYYLQRPVGINKLHRRWPWRRDSLNVKSNGVTFPVRLYSDVIRSRDGEICAMVTVSEDITQQKTIDNVLLRQQEELRLLFEMSLDGLCFLTLPQPLVWEGLSDYNAVVDTLLAELVISRANSVLLKQFDTNEELLGGLTLQELYRDDLPTVRRILLRLFTEGATRGEWLMTRQDGEQRQMEGFFVRLCDSHGHMTGLFAAQRDVSDRRRIERNLIAATRAAEQAARSKSEFLANMSHEIRTPMNGVLGMLQLLQMTDLSDEQKEFVDTAIYSGNALLAVINDILDFSKLEAHGVTIAAVDFDPRQLLSNTVAVFREQARRKGIDIDWASAVEVPPRLSGDPGRIRQILFNLLGNAIKFTDEGEIRVRLEGCTAHGEGELLCLSVADSGIGIPHDQMSRIFEPFTQADGSYTRQHQGTGLGLAIVRRLVEALGGTISLESRPGCGTTVFFSVRVSRQTIGTALPVGTVAAPQRATPLQLLVVEDNPINQLITRRQLEKMGHRVVCAGSGVEALEVLQRERCDVVLMDVQMPEMDGLEATRRLRGSPPPLAGIPVVAMTAHALPGDRERFLAAGMDDYIAKPVSLDQLRAALARLAPAAPPEN